MSTPQDRQRALEKIKKLLQLAKDDRGNPTEAETAMRQAQSLMAKFNIDESEAILTALKNDADAIVRQWRKEGVNANKTSLSKEFPDWCGVISYGVGKLYDCRTFIGNIREDGIMHGKCVVFVGYQVDVQVACWTFDYLCACVKRMAQNFDAVVKAGDDSKLAEFGIDRGGFIELLIMSPKARKKDFRVTMAAVLQNRLLALKEQRSTTIQQLAPEHQKGALALIDAKQQALDKLLGAEGETENVKKRWNAAFLAGALAASKTDLNPNPLQHKAPDGLHLLR